MIKLSIIEKRAYLKMLINLTGFPTDKIGKNQIVNFNNNMKNDDTGEVMCLRISKMAHKETDVSTKEKLYAFMERGATWEVKKIVWEEI